jgi:hypothetical protein
LKTVPLKESPNNVNGREFSVRLAGARAALVESRMKNRTVPTGLPATASMAMDCGVAMKISTALLLMASNPAIDWPVAGLMSRKKSIDKVLDKTVVVVGPKVVVVVVPAARVVVVVARVVVVAVSDTHVAEQPSPPTTFPSSATFETGMRIKNNLKKGPNDMNACCT